MLVRVMRADVEGVSVVFDEPKTMTIGRDLGCDVILESPTASRHHAHIEFDGETLLAKDNGSMNGILVNRQKCEQAELQLGDLLEVGGCIFMVESNASDQSNEGGDFNPEAATIEPDADVLRVRVMLDAREDDSLVFAEPCSVSIGRDPESMVVLTAASASRHHARLDWDGETLSVEDLDSTNGIFLNGHKASSAVLKANDMLVIGGSILSVFDLDDAAVFSDVEDLDEEALDAADNDPLHGTNDPTISVRKKPMADNAGTFNPEAATIEAEDDEHNGNTDSDDGALEKKTDS